MMDNLNFTTKIKNFFDIVTDVKITGLYAFYLYKNNEIIKRVPYKECHSYEFKNLQPGNYTVKVFYKTDEEIISKTSKVLYVRNKSATTIRHTNFILDKPNFDLLWISTILKDAYNIEHYLGDKSDNDTFNDLDSISFPSAIKAGSKILTCDSSKIHDNDYHYISLSQSSDNVLNEYLSRKSVVQLQQLSRRLYLVGLEKGAHYIWINMRRNSSCSISYKTIVGQNFRLGLGGIGTIIHPNATIGDNVKIAQHVTIGFSGGNSTLEGPVIGNNVYIAPGALCLGGKIGSNVVVAANAVVLDEIPDNCVVAGVPAKVISTNIDKYKNFLKK
ncbi:hypothetical protein [Jeotgalicoccus sp. ATCC 8456]|uniref:hypothetical protein n=1 Tax=Jeotgalicoccus sp. ATCC 8456 TaxID=946435 RepID=UPI0018E5B653|nr:hypothetical protein [Jeotgalicoccus sp. ATCC 8456]QQD85667.1 hypothetical protein JEM45_03315 [Jeotgalicoccus sp. ATCC 8456]